MQKNKSLLIGLILILALASTACGTTATPKVDVPLTVANACEFDNQVVELEGQLILPNSISCTAEEPRICTVYFSDPLNDAGFDLEIPAYTGTGELPVNQMAALPEQFDSSDFKIRTANDRFAGDKSLVTVRGKIEAYANTCRMTKIEAITRLDELVYVGVNLTRVTLQEALTDGLVVASITGNGLTQINLKIKPTVDINLEVEIVPGTMFISGSEGVQNMVVRQSQMVYLKPNVEVGVELEVSCANMRLKQPTYSDVFTISTDPTLEDLVKLLALEDYRFYTTGLQQFGVWTITDNPDYTYYYVRVESADGAESMADPYVVVLKGLFEEAGIDISKYHIFNQ